MSINPDVLYVINPKSNEGAAVKLWRKARKKFNFLPKDPVDITTVSLEEIIKMIESQIVDKPYLPLNLPSHLSRRPKIMN